MKERPLVVVPEGLAGGARGKTLPEPSFVFRQVLDYVATIATPSTVVYLAPANRFGGNVFEQEAAYAYLTARIGLPTDSLSRISGARICRYAR